MMSLKNLMFTRNGREIFSEIRCQISKICGVPNSVSISNQHNKLGVKILNLQHDNLLNENSSVYSSHNNIRVLSTIQTEVKPINNNSFVFSKDESREFMAIFPDIVRDLTDAGRHTDIPEVTKRFAHVLQYNVPTGKKTRGLSTVIAYKMLEKPENLTPENIRLANILGWCVELLRSFDVVVDDTIDNTPSWYKIDSVGKQAIANSCLLESSAYYLLKEHFSNHEHYVSLVEFFHDIALNNAMGKSLERDVMSTNGEMNNFSKMTMKNYSLIAKYKMGYLNLLLPVASAMYLTNVIDPELHRQARTILLEMGQYFQVQKDFLNCFGKNKITDTIRSDINEGKCSWLAVVALQRVNNEQRKIMETFYGKPGDEATEAIKNLYIQLSLPTTYKKHEEQTYKIIQTHIQQISKGLPHQLFFTLLDNLYTILQAYFLITDDVMDNSELRRGQPCWYKNKGVGLIAINDAILVENSIYSILRKYISHLPCYVPILELFHDITLKTAMGQSLDCLCTENGKPRLDQFIMKRYNAIVKYKTAYYTFQLPVAAAMYLANMYDEEQHRQAKTILLEMGEFFQIQDDFLDTFGDPAVTGKIGTDIRDGKCSWLAVVALQRATPSQKQIMEEHYGHDDQQSVQLIKQLYEELGLPSTYSIYEEESFNIIRTHIHQISKGLPHDLFFKILKKIYKRDC
ncbi:farnesyl pyrophosphate synthase [Diorhabda carinulata]|uniref:farnesyl pyrophosphate synthase n=1 Tax=Diorhabda carinulata TaxID=1163345 RepID=UPI0025A1785E|nr:farnesyl pyrophosphate synthase [Diorhabda carinulata]